MAADIEQGEVDITIAGTIYTLKLSMRAAKQLQKRNKKTIGELFSAAQRLDYDAISELMFGLLQHHHANDFPTVGSVDDLVDRAGGPKVFFEFCQKLEQVKETSDAPGVEGASDPRTAQAGTGTNSESLQPVSV